MRLEAEAKLCIQANSRKGRLKLAWSCMLDFDNDANPFEKRRNTIGRWRPHATIDVEETAAILRETEVLLELGLKTKDALHITCALAGECT